MAEYIVNLDCSEPIKKGDVNTVVIIHNKIERIVRCGDCKWYEDDDEGPFCTGIVFGEVCPDDFCSWGEPKEIPNE